MAVDQQNVLCIFKAEDAYISANDYPSKFEDHRKVPAWNYQVVHIHGHIQFKTDKKSKCATIGLLTKTNEEKTNGKDAWKMSDAPSDYLEDMLEKIVAFEIIPYQTDAISKLNQNRSKTDFTQVVNALNRRGKTSIATSMQRWEYA